MVKNINKGGNIQLSCTEKGKNRITFLYIFRSNPQGDKVCFTSPTIFSKVFTFESANEIPYNVENIPNLSIISIVIDNKVLTCSTLYPNWFIIISFKD